MASLRALLGCIGVDGGNVSILGDFFGFSRGRIPPDPTGVDVTVSLKRQFDRLDGDHFHLNIIRVGNEQFTDNDLIDRATPGTKDDVHAKVQANIKSAQNGTDANEVTNWNGPGITSSSARTANVATGFDHAKRLQ